EREFLKFLTVTELTTEYKGRRIIGYELKVDQLDQIRSEIGRKQNEFISKVLAGVLQATETTQKSVDALNVTTTKLNESSKRIEDLTWALIIITVVLGIFAVVSTSLQLASFHFPFWLNLTLEFLPIGLILIFV